MSLDHKTPGNPAFVKGVAQNPQGRPKGSLSKKSHPNVKERLLGKWQTHPVDKLVELANRVTATDPKLAIEIWTNLLKYFEPTKKPVESAPEKTTPEDSKQAAEETLKLLQEIEQNGFNPAKAPESSDGLGLENGPPEIQAEGLPKTDL